MMWTSFVEFMSPCDFKALLSATEHAYTHLLQYGKLSYMTRRLSRIVNMLRNLPHTVKYIYGTAQ